MSFPTQPAFVVTAKSGWGPDLTIHPMLKFMAGHEQLWDAGKYDESKPFYAPDFKYTKSTGQNFSGPSAFDQMRSDYAMFTEHFHEPIYGVATETENGYRLFGQAKMFVNLPGQGGERKFEDLQGRKWDCVALGAFIMGARKDAESSLGYVFTETQILADPTPILSEAIKRGVISVEALSG